MASKRIIVQPGQTLENIALQYTGSVDAVLDIVLLNRSVLTNGLMHDLVGGMQLEVPEVASDAVSLRQIQQMQVVPASGKAIEPSTMGPDGDFLDDYNEDHYVTN